MSLWSLLCALLFNFSLDVCALKCPQVSDNWSGKLDFCSYLKSSHHATRFTKECVVSFKPFIVNGHIANGSYYVVSCRCRQFSVNRLDADLRVRGSGNAIYFSRSKTSPIFVSNGLGEGVLSRRMVVCDVKNLPDAKMLSRRLTAILDADNKGVSGTGRIVTETAGVNVGSSLFLPYGSGDFVGCASKPDGSKKQKGPKTRQSELQHSAIEYPLSETGGSLLSLKVFGFVVVIFSWFFGSGEAVYRSWEASADAEWNGKPKLSLLLGAAGFGLIPLYLAGLVGITFFWWHG